MDLLEYQGKQLFARHDIPVPAGRHATSVDEASQIEAELYASILLDRSAKKPLVMLSTKGGMDIEAVAAEDPAAIATLHIDPLLGFQDFHGRRLAFEAGVP